jgi:hypothetical protein
MKRRFWVGTTLGAVTLLFSSIPTRAQDYSAKYSGFREVGGLGAGETGAILSTGQATLKLSVDKAAQTLTYSLTYSGLTNVLQAHIHFGKEHVAGGIMVFFCTNLGNGPTGTPVAALASDTAYGNIHTKQFPAGEIRGQVHADNDHDKAGDKDKDDNR